MMKVALLIALVLVGAAHGQELLAPGAEAAPEPYSYGYETETHSAAEQRDPAGKVSGYYMLADADGRQRRVEYIADEAGFRAKVATNEVGTKSENSADVEVSAQPPTREQLAQGELSGQRAATTSGQVLSSGVRYASYNQQPYGLYGANYGAYNGAYNGAYGYNGLNRAGYYGNGAFSSYNNHLPSQYYRSVQGYNGLMGVNNGVVGRYVTSGAVTAAPLAANTGVYRSASYQTIGAPAGAYSNGYYSNGNGLYGSGLYGNGYYGNGYGYSTVGPNGRGFQGSPNLVLLKKRAVAAAKKA